MNAEATLVEGNQAAVQGARILVVEDERIVARSLQKQLTAMGYEVVGSVPSGEEAIQQTGKLRPDLVLMDIRLEGATDGVDAAAAIRTQFRLPVIYLTAYSNQEILQRAKVTEPFGYILKPFEDRDLHVVIETALYKHRMERRQLEREQWFVATLKSIGDAVVATDDEGRITYMNPLAERLTGWVGPDALGQSLDKVVQFVHEGSRQPVLSPLDQAMHVGTSNTAILLIAKDRSEKPIENCVSIITDELGGALGCVVVFRDVTWQRHLEEQVRQAKKMEAIGRFAGGIAHALNNLMAVVLGHSEMMLDGMDPDDPFVANAKAIERSVSRTVALTEKLLALSSKQILSLRSVDLNALVVNGLSPVVVQMQDGIRLDLNLEPVLGLTRTDPDQLEEAILTLVQNACDAMPHGGQLTIQTANVELDEDYTHDHPEILSGPYVLLAVSDTGEGMAPEAISHMFEPFYTKEVGVGAGLGLAAAYGLVKQCGGNIEVRSQPEMGTTFRLYLPRVG
jgi:two-component system cell cycle sensor histidine kinase/response regulator CckA